MGIKDSDHLFECRLGGLGSYLVSRAMEMIASRFSRIGRQPGYPDRSNGLAGCSAPGSGYAAGGYRAIGMNSVTNASYHLPYRLFANRPYRIQYLGGHAQQTHLHVVGIGYDTAIVELR